jgi:hypothetical protein
MVESLVASIPVAQRLSIPDKVAPDQFVGSWMITLPSAAPTAAIYRPFASMLFANQATVTLL